MPDILCTICARGGSKGVPRKNVREVGGKPLIAHSIEHALNWERPTDIVVSTDDPEIRNVALEYGARAPFLRPDELATDEAAKLPVVQHATREMEDRRDQTYEYVVDLQPTSPLRDVTDVESCFQVVIEEDVTNAYTVKKTSANPYFNLVELDNDGFARLSKTTAEGVSRRQDAPPVFELNGAVYVFKRDFLLTASSLHQGKTKVSVMPETRSFDIDTPLDLEIVRMMMDGDHSDD